MDSTKKTIYYNSFSDDFIATKNQSKTVPENYKFIKKNPFAIVFGAILFVIFKLIARFYAHFALHLQIVGKDKLKSYVKSTKNGYYIYANHVLPYGDVYNPALYNPVHPYYICDSSNLGIPVLGPLLPYVGALPIPDSIRGKKNLFDAISARAKRGKAIIIYPEAHVWPYYTDIRPFEATGFNFPVRDNLPIFTATTTFQPRKAKHKTKYQNKKPRVTIYIDGPFYPDESLDKKARIATLHDQAYKTLTSRVKLSTYKYITYEKRDN